MRATPTRLARVTSPLSRPPATPRLGAMAVLLCVAVSVGACTRAASPPASAATSGGASGKPSGSEMSRAVVDPYVKIAGALASDSMEGVTAHAGEIATAASGLGAAAVKIDTAAVQLASAGDLADARAKFGALSEALDSYMTTQHLTPPEGIRVAFCPMVLKPWLQADGALRNPYYGSGMLTCGSFRNN
jgi:hypothetical protein